jgi:DNA-binding MarR family transcriptional regulator
MERGELSQNLLGRLVTMEPANIRDVVLRLRRRRLIVANKSKEDARVILLRLTPSGLGLARRLIPISVDSVAATLAALSADERTFLRELLQKVIGRIGLDRIDCGELMTATRDGILARSSRSWGRSNSRLH